MFNRAAALVLILLVLGPLPLSADGQGDGEGESLALEPVPYDQDEFPLWARKVRRAEVVFFGSVPITFLASTLGYSLYRLGEGLIQQNQQESSAFFVPSSMMTDQEKIGILSASLILSGTVMIIDFILGLGDEDE